ncbi:hypothetical protein DSECCO2_648870 [anaerobic digester metagenome]
MDGSLDEGGRAVLVAHVLREVADPPGRAVLSHDPVDPLGREARDRPEFAGALQKTGAVVGVHNRVPAYGSLEEIVFGIPGDRLHRAVEEDGPGLRRPVGDTLEVAEERAVPLLAGDVPQPEHPYPRKRPLLYLPAGVADPPFFSPRTPGREIDAGYIARAVEEFPGALFFLQEGAEGPASIGAGYVVADREDIHGPGVCPGHPHIAVEHEDAHPGLVEDLKRLFRSDEYRIYSAHMVCSPLRDFYIDEFM